MLIVSVICAPLVLASAAVAERRFGAWAAGWVAALPTAFGVSVLTVTVEAGADEAAALTLSAAAHVGAQVVFALVLARVLLRGGLAVAVGASVLTYALWSSILLHLPQTALIGSTALLLAAGPRFLPHAVRRRPFPRNPWTDAVISVAAAPVVALTVLASRTVGPQLAGAVAAFPVLSLTIVCLAVGRYGRPAGVQALAGLVRGLPCYLAFGLTVAATVQVIGLWAIPAGLIAAVGVAVGTWRGRPMPPSD